MPHISVKYFPIAMSEQKKMKLIQTITSAIQDAFVCKENIISISLEPVESHQWNENVFIPEIENKCQFLCKKPNY